MFLSVVIPAYNEQNRLNSSLDKIYNYFSSDLLLQNSGLSGSKMGPPDIRIRFNNKLVDYEVIVVNDASMDKTEEIALTNILNKKGRLKLINNPKNMGKGYSVKKGIFVSQGEYILFSDADLSTPIEEVEKLFSFVNEGYDIVIGSRSIKGAQIKVRQPFYREYMGKIFNFFVQAFVFKGIIDTQCGFKLFKAAAAKNIAKKSKIDGFSFDVEMLYLAHKQGYKIKEVPVAWINSPASKVNPVIDSYKMLIELLSIKKIHNEN